MQKIVLLALLFVAFGCTTEVHPELGQPEEILVVDAWLTQKMERQEIRITRSQAYFDNAEPALISNLTVSIEDLNSGAIYDFVEGKDAYYWDPVSEPFGAVGHTYHLVVETDGETFEAYSTMGRVPPVDSIKFKYNPSDLLIDQEYYTGEFVATDLEGVGDMYWIKAWKNGVFLGKPMEINMTYDASFTPGQTIDGQQFILPIRRDMVNPYDENPEKDNAILPPYLVGDSLYVEIHSIDRAAFDFLFSLYFQINRPGGFSELFAAPLGNVPTNIKSTNEASTTNVAGFFSVSAVSGNGQKLTQEIADQARSNH